MVRGQVQWTDKVPDRDSVRSVCYEVAFRPDGTQLVTGIGNRVLVYNAADGDLLHSLKGHKDTIYCVAYARDGKRCAPWAGGGEGWGKRTPPHSAVPPGPFPRCFPRLVRVVIGGSCLPPPWVRGGWPIAIAIGVTDLG